VIFLPGLSWKYDPLDCHLRVAGITAVEHHTWPFCIAFENFLESFSPSLDAALL
jgi:hypothetical protein